MALLSTFINAGAACLAGGANCFAHGLPTVPDFAVFSTITAQNTAPWDLSRGTAGVFIDTGGTLEVNSDALFATFYNTVR